MNAQDHILIVDDDREIRTLLADYLHKHGYRVSAVADGRAMWSTLDSARVDLIILDVMLPGDDGFVLCRNLQARGNWPVIMLTARGDDTDRIVGLELGADDYVPKPFNPRELLARVRAVMRRARPNAVLERLSVGPLEIDVPGHRVTVDGKDVVLTSFEFRLLVILARRAGDTAPREELASALKGGRYDPGVDRSLDVHVSHLRQKLGDDAREPKKIRTIRGVGYVLVRPA